MPDITEKISVRDIGDWQLLSSFIENEELNIYAESELVNNSQNWLIICVSDTKPDSNSKDGFYLTNESLWESLRNFDSLENVYVRSCKNYSLLNATISYSTLLLYDIYFNGTSYLQFTPVTLSGDFEIIIDVYWNGSNYAPLLWGSNFIRIETNGHIRLGYVGTTSSVSIVANVLTRVSIKRVGVVNTVEIDGVSENLTESSISSFTLSLAAKRAGSEEYFVGRLDYINIDNQVEYTLNIDPRPSWVFYSSIGNNNATLINGTDDDIIVRA